MQSVLTQDWDDFEYLVVDPGSTDETPEVIDRFRALYPGRITLIREPDSGPADGLNKAFARATGDLFGYLNADDLYLPGCFRAVASAASQSSRAAAIYGDGYKANADGRIVRRVVSTDFSPRRFLYGGTLVLQQSTFYRAEAFRAVGGFNAENRISWDIEILLDMALRRMPLAHVPGYWSVFRIHPASITGSQRLAEEGRKTRARYFESIMGRPKQWFDKVAEEFVFSYSMLLEPRCTAARIWDRIQPPNFDIAEIAQLQ